MISSFRGFFDATNTPKKNFKKIQHLKVMNGRQRERLQEKIIFFFQIWDTLLTKYPDMIVVWAHLGLSKVI